MGNLGNRGEWERAELVESRKMDQWGIFGKREFGIWKWSVLGRAGEWGAGGARNFSRKGGRGVWVAVKFEICGEKGKKGILGARCTGVHRGARAIREFEKFLTGRVREKQRVGGGCAWRKLQLNLFFLFFVGVCIHHTSLATASAACCGGHATLCSGRACMRCNLRHVGVGVIVGGNAYSS